ncbi:hypothetical protein D3C71_1903400 [compost metagenome]
MRQTALIAQLTDQLRQGDIGVLDQGLHGVDLGQRGIDIHRVIDAKHRLAYVVAATGGPPHHLLIEDP